MMNKLNINFDSDMVEAISAEFDLRTPNKEALRQLVLTLEGDYDPTVRQVLDLATGVGKTYLMAAFVEYLRRQGVGNVVIVTPGKIVQSKTVQNFTPGSPRYIAGSPVPPEVVTPQDYSAWMYRQNGAARLAFGRETPMLAFIFNIQQLIAPTTIEGDTRGTKKDVTMSRKTRRFDENAGVLFDYLKNLEDLVVIADESHLYGRSAAKFHAALEELEPAATIGLTASVSKKTDHVIYEYPLYRAIQDKYVKAPVLAFRKGGYTTDEASEEQQLRDALQLRDIKQTYYDAYADSHNLDHVNAVAFVVCSDIEHANQVASLLRTPEYFGNDQAVLQVDNKHEDELTQWRLNRLDSPESTVLAVVSVDKLKEGWDVKNIAVIVTLRTMASRVLTQQTMGRGLRLPFGGYTGIFHIDQLDIIAHQSFEQLLEAENVLQEFGLEKTVAEADDVKVKKAIRTAAKRSGASLETTAVVNDEGQSTATRSSLSDPGAAVDNPGGDSQPEPDTAPARTGTTHAKVPGLGFRAMTDLTDEHTLGLVSIERNPRFADVSYQFPVSTMQVQQPPIDLSEISNAAIEQAASRVTSAKDVLLRKEIIAALGEKLRPEDRESAEVDSILIDDADAQSALIKLVIDMPLVPTTEQTARYVSAFLVPKFTGAVTLDGWTVKSLDSARAELERLIKNYTDETLRGTRDVTLIHPKSMPGSGFTLPFGEKVHHQIETRDQFVRRRVYGGWFKSLFAEESFDSFTGEYQLARLLNTSPGIRWWHRLHPQDGAYVYFNAKERYFPDFVACDTDGVHWIIEGKDNRGRHDERVQAKRKAAESLVRRLVTEDAYVGQNWGYLIAYEDDTARADSWEDLKTFANPVSNVL